MRGGCVGLCDKRGEGEEDEYEDEEVMTRQLHYSCHRPQHESTLSSE